MRMKAILLQSNLPVILILISNYKLVFLLLVCSILLDEYPNFFQCKAVGTLIFFISFAESQWWFPVFSALLIRVGKPDQCWFFKHPTQKL